MPANRSTLDQAMKDKFIDPFTSLVNDNLLDQQITSGTVAAGGRKAVFALHIGRSSGVGVIADGGSLPTADNQKFKQGAVGLCTQVGRIELSGKTLRTINGGDNSYVSEPGHEVERMAADVRRNHVRQLFGTGDGVIAATGVTTSSNTVVVASGDLAKTGHLSDDLLVDIGTVANPTAVASGRTITAVNTNAAGVVTSIVISGAAVTTATTDRIFRAGSGGNQTEGGLTYGMEINGLQNIISDSGVLHTIDPATTPKWKSYQKAVGGALTDSEIMLTSHSIYRATGSAPTLAITTDGVLRSYGNSLTSLKRSNDTVELKGGYNGLSTAIGGLNKEVVIAMDRDVPGGQAFFVDPSCLKLHTTGDWKWDDSDGAVFKHISGRDAVEAYVIRDVQLATNDRRRLGKLTGLTEA
jgi:hypothetical protein